MARHATGCARRYTRAHATRRRAASTTDEAPSPAKPREAAREEDGSAIATIRLTGDRLVVRAPGQRRAQERGRPADPGDGDAGAEAPAWGDVTLVGPDVRVAKQGDRVLFLPSSGLEVELDGEDLVLLRERDVQAVIVAADARRTARPASTCSGSARHEASRTVRTSFSRFGSTSTTDCQVPSATSPSITGTISDGDDEHGQQVVAAVAERLPCRCA